MASIRVGNLAFLTILLIALVSTSGCISQSNDLNSITLYSYSISSEVIENSIIPEFQDYWHSSHNETITFETSSAGSGTITNQILAGAPAEVAILSNEYDAIRLKKAGKIKTDWHTFPYGGIVMRSPMVMVVRKGNPKNITSFLDLTKPGIKVIHTDPSTSGGAMWSIFAIYGSALKESELKTGHKNYTYANEVLEKVESNVISMPSSSRKAMTIFDAGIGDVLITYETDALISINNESNYEIIYPNITMLSEQPVVIIDSNVNANETSLINSFVMFLFSKKAQETFADNGFRSVNGNINSMHKEFKYINYPLTIDYLGGWETAKSDIIDNVWSKVQSEK